MKTAEIRRSFVDFFATRDHAVVKSSPLIPQDDPTILFANAGMNQFKRIFQGQEKSKFPRAVSVQKCIRAGGKHNDLENVGVTSRHHTFFEMLGNFSFGDYFKEEAIGYAWEWVTKVIGLPVERLYATVYTDDDEAADLWARVAPELAGRRILRFGRKDNYWSMGDTGPNGPCSELHYDRGEKYGCGKLDCRVNCECDRYMEIWNLVFMQYNTDETGASAPLPRPSIDTGAGLERIAAILQDAESNYDTDLFLPLIQEVATLSGHAYDVGPAGTPHRVIADHVRALSFSIADGAGLSNEGRGYVLRRILRRAARHGRELGFHEPFLARLLTPLIDIMGDAYPELAARRDHIAAVLTSEEQQFVQCLDVGLEFFERYAREAEKAGHKALPGDAVFKLYDTYGFPVDLTAIMARERGLSLDEEGFNSAMAEQRSRSRAGSGFAGGGERFAALVKRHEGTKTEFLYNTYEMPTKLLHYAPAEGAVILDRTPFYVESGGQVSDVGKITAAGFEFAVQDMVRDGELILHLGEPLSGTSVQPGDATAIVARERRLAIERNHTATHLLHAALRTVLGEHVHQAGSLVAPDRLRFDFTHHAALSTEEIDRIEAIVNGRVLENIALDIEWSDFDAAKERGAMALFGEKYGDRVRVVAVPGFSIELCGGTHVRATGEIGLFRIISESAVAAGVRRIEAITGEGARQWVRERERLLEDVGRMVKGETAQIPVRVERLLDRQKQLESRIRQLEAQAARQAVGGASEESEEVNGHRFTLRFGPEWQRDRVMAFADELKKSSDDQSGIFGNLDAERGKVSLFVAASPAALKAGIHAGKAVQEIAGHFDGRGGGKPHLGQGGFDAGSRSESELRSELKQAVQAYFQKL